MTLWTPLAVNYFRHPKVAGLTPRARLLHLAGFCYCQEHTTDGFIPAGVLGVLCAESGAPRSAVSELVAGDLWDEVDGGWRVDGWHDWNRYAEDIEAAKAKARERKRKQRDKDRTVTGQSRDVTHPHTHTQSQPPKPPNLSPVDNSKRRDAVYDLRQRMTIEQLEQIADLGEL